MKIALVCRYYNKSQGIPTVVAELAERFIENHEVHVFTQTWKDVGDDRIIFHKVPAIAPNCFINELTFFFLSGSLVKKHQFDIINYHDPCYCPGGIFTSHAFPAAGVQMIRELDKKRSLGLSPFMFLPFILFYPISNYNLKSKKTKGIIAVSQMIKNKIVELIGRDKNQIKVLANGVDLTKFNNKNRNFHRKTIIKRHNLNEDDFILLFVGYYHFRKGLPFLIQALSLIDNPRIKLLVVGNDSSVKKQMSDLTANLKLEKKIIFVGDQPHVQHYFAVGNALVLPTLYEPFGMVALQAMAAGLPVIVSRSAGASDLIDDKENGLILNDPTDAQEIASKILFLFEKRKERKRIEKQAVSTSRKYTWDILAEKTLAYFHETIQS